jgi:hypothetical protein
VLISPPPWERGGDHEDRDDPHDRHPPCGVEAHEVAAAGRLGPEVVPAPSAAVAGVDFVFIVPTGDAVVVDDRSIVGTALWTFSRVSHEGLLLRCRAIGSLSGASGVTRR